MKVSYLWVFVLISHLIILTPITAVAGMTSEEVTAFERYKLNANMGDRVAQFNLGVCYARGQGVERDDTRLL
jgi:hypothetical protein